MQVNRLLLLPNPKIKPCPKHTLALIERWSSSGTVRNYTTGGHTGHGHHHNQAHTIKGSDHKEHMIKNLITFNPTYHKPAGSDAEHGKSSGGVVDLSTVYEFAKQPPSSITLKVCMTSCFIDQLVPQLDAHEFRNQNQ